MERRERMREREGEGEGGVITSDIPGGRGGCSWFTIANYSTISNSLNLRKLNIPLQALALRKKKKKKKKVN
jgi:hypothetical protein